MNKYRVLIVEDDGVTKAKLAEVIEREGFEVVTAEHGKEALEILKTTSCNIVIADLKMPHVDGLELLHTVKRIAPDCEVILTTAYGETDTVITAIREGALDYLKKPIDLNQLIITLGRAKELIAEKIKVPFFPHLLLAEDDTSTRERLARVLEKENWTVNMVADGVEAMAAFQNTKVDIVLMDIKMPRKNGLDALHEMRTITSDFEAIIFSGHGDESQAIQALRAGAACFLKKPIDLDELIIAVEKANEKLTLKRSLKYRLHELELTRAIIAKITAEHGFTIDVRNHMRKAARDLGSQLLDILPLGLLVLDRSLNIRFANHGLNNIMGFQPSTFDEKLVARLGEAGIKGLVYETLVADIKTIFDAPGPRQDKIMVNRNSSMILAAAIVQGEEKKETMVVMAVALGGGAAICA